MPARMEYDRALRVDQMSTAPNRVMKLGKGVLL